MRTTIYLLIWLFGFIYSSNGFTQIYLDQASELGITAMVQAQGWGAGISVFDFNGDGLDDLTLASNVPAHYFYLNNGNGFEEIDLGILSSGGASAAKQIIWVDYDDDNDYDLLVTYFYGTIELYKNLGNLEFVEVTADTGLPQEIAANYGASFADIDRDGDLDLLICRYQGWDIIPDSPNEEPQLWSRFFINSGDGTFIDQTIEQGLTMTPKPAFQGAFLDYNNDLWPDLHVIIDRPPGNHLFKNVAGQFIEQTDSLGVSFPENDFMSNSVSDYDNDGYLDYFMTNTGSADDPSYLIRNLEGDGFEHVDASAGLEIPEFGWGALWVDVDNDGWQDMFFATPGYEENHLYLNEYGVFTDISQMMETNSERPSFTSGKGDFNNDFKYDIAVNSVLPNLPHVFVNQDSANSAIKITLKGSVSNSMAVGSWIKIYEEEKSYHHYTMCGQDYISQSSQHLIFGLGDMDQSVDSVIVTYPSGHTDSYYELPVDSHYYFVEGETYIASLIASDTLVCEGETVILDAGEHDAYLWNTGETSQTIEVDSSGVFIVEVTNEFGISISTQISIQVSPNPSIVETIIPNPCSGDSLASIDLLNSTGIPVDSVLWTNGQYGSFIDSLPSGTYSYIFTDIFGCQGGGDIEISDSPELIVFANSEPSDPVSDNGQIFITIFGGIAPYVIIFDGDTVGTNITDLAPGIYNVSIIDSYGCEKIVTIEVESTLNTTERDFQKIEVFPNPAINHLEINPESGIILRSISLIDSKGNVLWTRTENLSSNINLERVESGLYLLRIEMENGAQVSKRIIVID